jgi:hypothetical protein
MQTLMGIKWLFIYDPIPILLPGPSMGMFKVLDRKIPEAPVFLLPSIYVFPIRSMLGRICLVLDLVPASRPMSLLMRPRPIGSAHRKLQQPMISSSEFQSICLDSDQELKKVWLDALVVAFRRHRPMTERHGSRVLRCSR